MFGQLCGFQGPAGDRREDFPARSLKTQQRAGGRERTPDPGPVDISGRRVALRPSRRARP